MTNSPRRLPPFKILPASTVPMGRRGAPRRKRSDRYDESAATVSSSWDPSGQHVNTKYISLTTSLSFFSFPPFETSEILNQDVGGGSGGYYFFG